MVETMNEKNISTMLKEILTLRYYPSLDINTKKYGSTDFEPKNSPNYLDHIEKLILNTMENEINEKKISVALSGGVDSTLLIGLLRKALPDIVVEAISVKFADSVDETTIAANIANKFNANHHVVKIENFLEQLPKAISIIKMPFWDTHWYHIVKTAKEYSGSLVSGDGGDELFGGYTFRYEKFLLNYNSKMTSLEKTKLYLECHERDWVPNQHEVFGEKSHFSWDEIYSKLIPYFDNSLSPIDQIFLADINGKLLYNWTPLNSRFHNYFKLKAIRPLFSNELITYATHLDNSLKYNPIENIGKLPLRQILAKYVDSNLITPKKQGFSVNTKNLWKSQGMKLCAYYLDNCRIAEEEWVNKEWIKDHLRILKHDYDVRYINKFLGLLALEIWYRIFITKEMRDDTVLSV